MNQVGDILTSCSADDPTLYSKVREHLISAFIPNADKSLAELFSTTPLNARRPSHMFREMRNITANANLTCDNQIIKTLWLQKLPVRFREILSVMPDDINTLITNADKLHDIIEAHTLPSCAAVSTIPTSAPTTTSANAETAALRVAVESLTKQMSLLQGQSHQRQVRSKFRSKSRIHTPPPTKGDDNRNKFCYLHERYGDKAHRCKASNWCEFKS